VGVKSPHGKNLEWVHIGVRAANHQGNFFPVRPCSFAPIRAWNQAQPAGKIMFKIGRAHKTMFG
jgi:hypothetical protein